MILAVSMGEPPPQTQNAVTAGFLGHFVSLVHHVFHGFSGDVIISDIVYTLFIQGLGDLLGQTGHLHALVVDHDSFFAPSIPIAVLDGGDTANAEGDGALLCVVAELFIGSIIPKNLLKNFHIQVLLPAQTRSFTHWL